MTESQFTSRLARDLESTTGGHAIKHCDRFTGGIPDLTITVDGVTTWVESKMGDNVATRLQLWTMRRLKRALCVTWYGTLRRGFGTIAIRGDDLVGGSMSYYELVRHVAKLASEDWHQ